MKLHLPTILIAIVASALTSAAVLMLGAPEHNEPAPLADNSKAISAGEINDMIEKRINAERNEYAKASEVNALQREMKEVLRLQRQAASAVPDEASTEVRTATKSEQPVEAAADLSNREIAELRDALDERRQLQEQKAREAEAEQVKRLQQQKERVDRIIKSRETISTTIDTGLKGLTDMNFTQSEMDSIKNVLERTFEHLAGKVTGDANFVTEDRSSWQRIQTELEPFYKEVEDLLGEERYQKWERDRAAQGLRWRVVRQGVGSRWGNGG